LQMMKAGACTFSSMKSTSCLPQVSKQ
jgi:hypothetical protein